MVHALFLLRDTVHHYFYIKYRSLRHLGFTTYLGSSFKTFGVSLVLAPSSSLCNAIGSVGYVSRPPWSFPRTLSSYAMVFSLDTYATIAVL